MSKHYSGFTLVELSIVLVIIGLLIGGILVGQSLIDSAKLQSFTRKISQYDVATVLFAERYRSLPGDTTLLPGVGNGDREIDSPDQYYTNVEVGHFWLHLGMTGLKNENGGDYNMTMSNGIGSENLPIIDLTEDVYIFGTSYRGVVAAFETSDIVSGFLAINCDETSGSIGAPLNCSDAFTGGEAASIDIKLDDGNGEEGNIVGVTGTNFDEFLSFYEENDIAHSASNVIDRSLIIRMGFTSNLLD